MQVKDKYFNGQDVDGEVGIEVELEGANLPSGPMFNQAAAGIWGAHHDGSLRGSSCEIVLTKPVPREEVHDTLDLASNIMKEVGAILEPSVRTGVHIHVNIRHLTMEQTFIYMLTFLLFETALVRYCGEDRQGNLFCLRSQDAEAYLGALETAIRSNDFNKLYTDQLRYSAMNPKALCEYGSLEFRCLKTPKKIKAIEEWVDILLRLKDFSLTIKDPRDLIERISIEGGFEIAKQCFGEYAEMLDGGDWTVELYEGLRRIQPAVFSRSWNSPENEDVVLHTELPDSLYEAKLRGALIPKEVVELNPQPRVHYPAAPIEEAIPLGQAEAVRNIWADAARRPAGLDRLAEILNDGGPD